VLLQETVKAIPENKGKKQSLLADLVPYAEKFILALGASKDNPAKKFLPMRNLLAHGGRLSDEMVGHYLKIHTESYEKLLAGLSFLSVEQGVKLVASPPSGPAWQLQGWPLVQTEFDRSLLPLEFQQAGPDRMLLVTPKGVLDLCPLHAYGEIFHIHKNEL
jgi:hypothetical protein